MIYDNGVTDQFLTKPDTADGSGSTTYDWSSALQQAPAQPITEPVVASAPTATADPYVASSGPVQQGDGSVTLASASTYAGKTINDFLSGYTTQQIQGMTDAQRTALLGQVQSQYQIDPTNDSGLFGTGISGPAIDVYNYLKIVAGTGTLPSIKEAALMPAYLTPGDKSGNQPLMDLLGLSAFYNPSGGTGEVAPTASGTAGSNTVASGGTGSGTTSVADGGTAINRLIDLAAAMYAGAGVKGGGTGFGGLVGGSLADTPTNTGQLATPTPTSHKGLIVVVLLLAGLAFWYYKKHHKGA